MEKGSGNGISMGSSDRAKTELNLGDAVASVSEIDTTLELQRLEGRWFTKDERVVFRKRKQGWTAFSYSDPIRKAFEEYGIIISTAGTNSYAPICFSSLKEARQAVNDVSLEAGLNIDFRLTRQHYVSYKIGDLPLRISKNQSHWRIIESTVPRVPPLASLQTHFNSTQEFRDAWKAADITREHPTRKAAHQTVINWLSQTIAKGK
jgi:hypothetical protein